MSMGSYSMDPISSMHSPRHNLSSTSSTGNGNGNNTTNTTNNNNNSSGSNSGVIPVINTVCIEFIDHMLYSSTACLTNNANNNTANNTNNTNANSHHQYIWIFLPVNIKRTKSYGHLLGYMQLSGTALPTSLSNTTNTTNTTSRSFVKEEYQSYQEEKTTDGKKNEEEKEEKEKVKIVEVIEYIEESSCRIAGYVYKILVQHNNNNSTNKDYLKIHWIADIEDEIIPYSFD